MAELNIVLYEPEIPANTGNIGRTCVATGTKLHLIEPLGFRLDEKIHQTCRNGLLERPGCENLCKLAGFPAKKNREPKYIWRPQREDMFIPKCPMNRIATSCLEKESAGIPEEILKENPDTCVRIPMIGETRSLNLSNSVAIVLYEALRQNEFDHMKLQGELHRLKWDD